MVCKKCGKNILELAILTEEEVKDFEYIQAMSIAINTLIEKLNYNPDLKKMEVIINEIYSKKASVDINRVKFIKDVKKKYNIDGDFYIEKGRLLRHE